MKSVNDLICCAQKCVCIIVESNDMTQRDTCYHSYRPFIQTKKGPDMYDFQTSVCLVSDIFVPKGLIIYLNLLYLYPRCCLSLMIFCCCCCCYSMDNKNYNNNNNNDDTTVVILLRFYFYCEKYRLCFLLSYIATLACITKLIADITFTLTIK